jgi:LemA protein
MNQTYIIIGIIVFVIILIILMYNSLIARKNQIENIEGSINALLKKRYNLIPNLVESVKGYMKHEKEVLEEITRLRSQAMKTQNIKQKTEIENKISSLLDKILVNVENYPELKANQNFLQLQDTLVMIESEIAAARRAYNQAVTDYNNAIEMFPTNIIASIMHLKKKEVFEIPDNQKENIKVEF